MYTKITSLHSQVRLYCYCGEWSFLCLSSVLFGHQASLAGCWMLGAVCWVLGAGWEPTHPKIYRCRDTRHIAPVDLK